MDKKIVGLVAAVSGLGAFGAAQASTPAADVERVMNPQSFAELLEPIPNATALLQAAGEVKATAPDSANIQVAWWHHHHHHHWYWHHHHHHNWYWHHHHHHWWWHHHHHWY
jgi:hypothetical protein